MQHTTELCYWNIYFHWKRHSLCTCTASWEKGEGGQTWWRKEERKKGKEGRRVRKRERSVECSCFRFYICTQINFPVNISRKICLMFYYNTKGKKFSQPWYLYSLCGNFLLCFKNWKWLMLWYKTQLWEKISFSSKQSCIWNTILNNKHSVFQVKITGCEDLLVASTT